MPLNRRLFMSAVAGLGLLPKDPAPAEAVAELKSMCVPLLDQTEPATDYHDLVHKIVGEPKTEYHYPHRSWSAAFRHFVVRRDHRRRQELYHLLAQNRKLVAPLAEQLGIRLWPESHHTLF